MPNHTQERGVVLLAVLGVALLLALTVATLLILSSTHARTGRYQLERLKARYAAESGVAWAYTQLVHNLAFDGQQQNPDLKMKYLPADGPQDMSVDVTVTPLPGPVRRIQSRVVYQQW